MLLRRPVLAVRAENGSSILITSTQNPAVKHCVKLRTSSSYRREAGSVLLVGRDLVLEAAAGGASLTALVGLEGAPLPDVDAARFVSVSEAVMAKLAGLESVSRATLAAEVALPPAADLLALPPGALSRVLVLDGIQDPGNLGTLLRTALALGWQAAVLLPGCCDAYNDKALKASRGAVFRLPVVQYSLDEWDELARKQGLVSLAADPDRSAAASPAGSSSSSSSSSSSGRRQAGVLGGSLADMQGRLAAQRLCLCLGAEGQGVSDAVRQRCTSVSIPQSGEMESLNAAAAGAILMFALSAGAAPLLADLAALPAAEP